LRSEEVMRRGGERERGRVSYPEIG